MHLEILVEDSSGRRLLEAIVPKIIGPMAEPHTWNIHDYKGAGHLPPGLKGTTDPRKRVLLDRLPKLLRGYGKTPGIDGVLILVDCDNRDCVAFLGELQDMLARIANPPRTIFRLAIEEVEAWYLGDRAALTGAYPKARRDVLDRYHQDSVCGTWELLADAIQPGGAATLKASGYPAAGEAKHDWAERMGPLMDPTANASPSFRKFAEALRRLTTAPRPDPQATGPSA